MAKARADIRPYTRQFFRGNWGNLLLALLDMLLSTAGALLVSWLIQQIVDLVGGVDTGYTLREVAFFSLLVIMLLAAAYGFSYFSKPRFRAKATLQYRNYVFSELMKKGISAFSGENTALYISVLSNDVNAIETGYLTNIFLIIDQALLLLGALALMFYYSPLLTLVSIGIALLPFAVSVLTGSLVEKAEKKVSDQNETYMSTLRDCLTGFSVIKSFQAEKQILQLFSQRAREVAQAKEFREKMAIIVQACANTAGIILQLGIFLIGAYLALSGSSALSAGTVMVFVQLLNFVLGPIGLIPQALAECKASRALIVKVADALETNVRQEGACDKRLLTDGISVDRLSFAYEEGKPVLSDLSFRFEAGKSYCLVGSSGSGKSTLLSLLIGASHGYDGSIRYDDAELTALSSEALYSMISVIQQNVFIFNASIRDNITMFSNFPREAVDRATEMSGLAKMIEERGEGCLCGENGNGLSGGEKQRIAIARSLLRQSQVLLVDEATAALDAQTAHQVTSAILGLTGLTRIVVSHALDEALLRRYDCILTLKNGVISESGSFDELIDRKGYFYSLYTVSQA